MKAVVAVSPGNPQVSEVPAPEPGPDTILVKTHYVGLNPADWATIASPDNFPEGQIVGCDFCGTVLSLPTETGKSGDLKVGDLVCGVVAAGAACDKWRGSFAEVVAAYPDFVFKLPAHNLTEPQAATLCVGLSTIATAFFEDMGLRIPDRTESSNGNVSNQWMLVYSGATTTGLLAIQVAKLCGFKVVTTCSPTNFQLVKSLGADAVFDYHDAEACISGILETVSERPRYALNCVGGDEGFKICDRVVRAGGKCVTTIPASPELALTNTFTLTMAPSVMADPYKGIGGLTARKPSERESGIRFCNLGLKWIEEGKLTPPPIFGDIRNGLGECVTGMRDLQDGKVKGGKIVVKV